MVQSLGAVCHRNRSGEHLQVRETLAGNGFDLMTLDDPSWGVGGNAPSPLHVLLRTSHVAPGSPRDWLFLDTETTGLAGGTGTYAFLVGLARVVDGCIEVEQFFMRDFREEASMLAEVATRLSGKRMLITFNGKAFDWPLLETRFRMQRMRLESPPDLHLDLLHPARHLWRAQLGSASLGDLERGVLDIRRKSDVLGEQIPRIYFDYLRGGSSDSMVEVFRHNEDDLMALVGLTAQVLKLLAPPAAGLAGDGQRTPSPFESYGLSRLFRLAGWRDAAREHYEKAVAGALPGELRRTAQRTLAELCKREHNYDRATELWEELIDDSTGSSGTVLETIRAYEQLAIYYEHHARKPERAAELTVEALDQLRHWFRQSAVGAPSSRTCPERKLALPALSVFEGSVSKSRGSEGGLPLGIGGTRYRKLKLQLEHRLARLARKSQPPLLEMG